MIATRSSLLALALVAACGGGVAVPGSPGAAAPAPHGVPMAFSPGGPWRYHYDRVDSITTTLPNGGQQQQAVERHLQLRWEALRAANGLSIRITIDSADLVGMPGGLGRAMEDSARGSVIQMELTPDGVVSTPSVTPENSVARGLMTDLPWLIPALPHSLMPGAFREDTLTSTVRFGVLDLSERTQRRTTVGAAVGSFDLSGEVTREGVSPQLHLTGSGLRVGRADFAPQGWMRDMTGRDSLAMTATVESIGQSVGLMQISGYSLTALP